MTASIILMLLIAGAAFAQQSVTILTPDGHTMHADQYGVVGRKAVVLVHGGRFNKGSWAKQADLLTQKGFCALAIDFREDHPDVLAAVRYLHSNGANSVAVVGASYGGDAAGDAAVAASPGEIDKLVLLASLGGKSPSRLKGKKLFILSRDDANSAGPRLPKILAAYKAAPGPKRLVILAGSAHAQFLFDTDQAPRLMQEILQFLMKR